MDVPSDVVHAFPGPRAGRGRSTPQRSLDRLLDVLALDVPEADELTERILDRLAADGLLDRAADGRLDRDAGRAP